MKKIITIAMLLFSVATYAQGNLQFNQVKLISTVQTVPVGKVWKVESMICSGGNTIPVVSNNTATITSSNGHLSNSIFNLTFASMTYLLNNTVCYVDLNSQYSISNLGNGVMFKNNSVNFPIWIPAGTSIEAGINMSFISIIEYNIVQ
jgi:hypothetical protein